MPITATYTPANTTLTVTGTSLGETMTIERDVAGALLVNGGTVSISGGPATIANTSLITATGGDGDDVITLNEASGALPKAELSGGIGNDALTGGSGNDTLRGDANNDTLLGRGGFDFLYGGADNDTLTGGDSDDQMFGEAGDDRMIWNPGDDSDLMEGGDGTDIAEVNGGNGTEIFTIAANGTRVRFDRVDPAPFSIDIGTTESLILNMGGGNDQVNATGNLAALINLTIDGGAGDDIVGGGNGIDSLYGGDGADFVDGNQGNDIAFLGIGNDRFNWDPGDGSDMIDGQEDFDALLFNASNANETINLFASGQHVNLLRDVGAITLDMTRMEQFFISVLGGADTITVSDLAGTAATRVDITLAGILAGSSGDGQPDTVNVNGSDGANAVTVTGSGTSVSVTGLAAQTNITYAEGANDRLFVNGLGDNDGITATTLAAGVISLTLDGGAGNDTLLGSQGNDTFVGGDGNDYVLGDNGNDTAFLGANDDIFEWAPGDGNDIVEGQDGFDELRFNGANVAENINIAANGARLLFNRDVANVIMDLNDVEKIRLNILGGADTITVGDLTGTDAKAIDLLLAASGGGGDNSSDNVIVNGSNVTETIAVNAAGGAVVVSGLTAAVSLFDAEAGTDRLTINGAGGDDTIDAGLLAAGLIQLTLNGGLGNDRFFGSAGNDLINGGDGLDTAYMGDGNDVFIWNPGDDNDIVEGQAGLDTLLFNGANVAETINISASGGRVLFNRDVANVVIDLDDTEVLSFTALGGADTINVNDLGATDVTQIFVDLAGTAGGGTGDGAADKVTLNGTAGANTIALTGNAAQINVTGLPAAAVIRHVEATDSLIILAGNGNDTFATTGLASGALALTLDGGDGNDVIQSTGEGTYRGGIGNDLIQAGLTSNSEILDGGDGIDTLDTRTWTGAYTINMISGVTNFAGESFVNFENVISGIGADNITGTTGANFIGTGDGVDNINAGDGDDRVEGGAGGDTMNGGIGVDTLVYGSSNAAVTVSLQTNGASGGHAAGDTFFAFENITGSAFADTLTGNGLNNTLDGGAGADILAGSTGGDTYIVDNTGDVVNELAGEGFDAVYASVSYALSATTEVEWLSTLSNAAVTAINLTGNAIGQYLIGNAGANQLDGKGGADFMQGLGGDDTYYVDNGSDAPVEAAGEGFDSVYVNLSFGLAIGTSIEWLSTTNIAGTQAINLLGNEIGNFLIGNDGANALDGATGADFMQGYGGNDTYIVDNIADQVVEAAGGGFDAIYTTSSFALSAGSEVEWLSAATVGATTALSLTGNAFNNYVLGNNGANTINGGAGTDILYGYGGADSFQFTTVLGAANVDTITDFVSGTDKIALDDAIFTTIGAPGALAAGAFVTGNAAADANDRIVYNALTGQLFYDADGTGAGAAVLFATLQGNPSLAASDFLVF